MNVLRQHLHVFDRRGRQDPVTEIEDVSGTAANAREDFIRLVEHPLRRTEQQRRIQVSLNASVVTDA